MIRHKIEYMVNPYLFSTGSSPNGSARANSRFTENLRTILWVLFRPDMKLTCCLFIM